AEADTIAAFREAHHPGSGEPLFERVYAAREHFGCDPIERGWPDVIAIPMPGFHTRSKFDGSRGNAALLRGHPTLTGTHPRESVLMIRAPQMAGAMTPGSRHVVEMRDVAPTILGLLGLPPGNAMTGRCLVDGIVGWRSTQRQENGFDPRSYIDMCQHPT